jgi:hypothetical protein
MATSDVLHAAPAGGGARTVRRWAFRGLLALLTLFLAFFVLEAGSLLVLGWLPRVPVPDWDPIHRLHDTVMGVLIGGMFAGTVVQWRRPDRRIAPLMVVLAVSAGFTFGDLLSGFPDWFRNVAPLLVVPLVLAALHPRVGDLLRTRWRDAGMVAAGLVGAAGWLWMAADQIGVQRAASAADPHAVMEHYARMGTLGITLALWGLVAASDRPGWRMAAWASVIGAVVYGLQSLIWPNVGSAASTSGAVAALAWAGAVAVTAWRRRRGEPSPDPVT